MTNDKVRNKETYDSAHLYSAEELTVFVDEVKNVDNDPNIIQYPEPTVEELKKIIQIAENYKGDWYHSNVVLLGKQESAEKEILKKRIVELGEDHGIYYLFDF